MSVRKMPRRATRLCFLGPEDSTQGALLEQFINEASKEGQTRSVAIPGFTNSTGARFSQQGGLTPAHEEAMRRDRDTEAEERSLDAKAESIQTEILVGCGIDPSQVARPESTPLAPKPLAQDTTGFDQSVDDALATAVPAEGEEEAARIAQGGNVGLQGGGDTLSGGPGRPAAPAAETAQAEKIQCQMLKENGKICERPTLEME